MQVMQSKQLSPLITKGCFQFVRNFDAVDASGNATNESIEHKAVSSLSEWMEDKVAASDRPELTSAGAVVSGGRGVGSDADFAMIEKLAISWALPLEHQERLLTVDMRLMTGK